MRGPGNNVPNFRKNSGREPRRSNLGRLNSDPTRRFVVPQSSPTLTPQHGSCVLQPAYFVVPPASGQRPAAGRSCCQCVRQSNQASLVAAAR